MPIKAHLIRCKLFLESEGFARKCAYFAIFTSIILALPSLWVPLGLPAEGDAVDYRIPMVRWILRHHAFPNWPWTMVDDYPALGDLLMALFYWITPGAARLVAILSYLGLAYFGGRILVHCVPNTVYKKSTLVLLGMAWLLGLRPVALMSNLLMVDNFAYCFLLGAICFLLEKRAAWAGFCVALALATRYTVWPLAALLVFFVPLFFSRKELLRSLILFCGIAICGALPFLLRNYLVNHGNPFFPIGDPAFKSIQVDNYGRGKDWLSFVMLPWDILYTNTFQNGFFDYTIGKLFYVQLSFFILFGVKSKKFFLRKNNLWLAVFALLQTVVWFRTGQQLRFLIPALVLVNILMLAALLEKTRVIAIFLALLTSYSVFSIQRDSLLLAAGRKEVMFAPYVRKAGACFLRSGVGNDAVAYINRDGVLGFFDHDYYYLKGHPYGIASAESSSAKWVYDTSPRAGYVLWPQENPCLLKKL